MKTTLRHFSALGLALLPLAAARAELDPSIVPAESRWVVSLDLDRVRASLLGQELLDLIELPEFGRSDVASLRPDPQKILATISSVTAYGSTFSKDPKQMDGVLILQGTADLRKLAEAYIAQATVSTPEAIQTLKDLPFEAYQLPNNVTFAFPKEPIVLLSQSPAQLVKALDVFRHHKGSLARMPSPLTALLPKPGNTSLVAACIAPGADELADGDGPQARVLQMANAGSLAVGTDAQTTTAQIALVANSPELAEKLQKIVQGVAAMASLTETDDKQLAEFLRSVNVTRDGNRVSLHLAYPTEGIVRMVKGFTAPPPPKADGNNHASPHIDASGEIVASWTADQDVGQPAPNAEGLVTRTIADIALRNGTIITLTGHRNQGENARIDCVEIISAQGGQPLLFEAENMKLSGYRAEPVPFASRGKLIITTKEAGTARFEFPGADGTYTLKVRYLDESDGQSTFTVATKAPDEPAPEQ